MVNRLVKFGGWEATQHLPNYDPINDRSDLPTIVQLCDSDEDNTHVVGVCGDWIFDSNRGHALPLEAASLDACCVGAATFLRVSYAVRLVPGRKLLKKRKRAEAGDAMGDA